LAFPLASFSPSAFEVGAALLAHLPDFLGQLTELCVIAVTTVEQLREQSASDPISLRDAGEHTGSDPAKAAPRV